jgi:hypothetical protein
MQYLTWTSRKLKSEDISKSKVQKAKVKRHSSKSKAQKAKFKKQSLISGEIQ